MILVFFCHMKLSLLTVNHSSSRPHQQPATTSSNIPQEYCNKEGRGNVCSGVQKVQGCWILKGQVATTETGLVTTQKVIAGLVRKFRIKAEP
jgi:hypothetical protein